jgi:hypothetical protein
MLVLRGLVGPQRGDLGTSVVEQSKDPTRWYPANDA